MSGFSQSAITDPWGLVNSWTYSEDVAVVPFINLAGLSDILVMAVGVAVSVSGVALIQVSTDNGSTYYSTSGNYIAIDSAGASANTIGYSLYGTNSTSARNGVVIIHGANVTGAPRAGVLQAPATAPLRLFTADNTNDIDAIRIVGSAGGNLTAGSLYVFGR